MQIRQSNIFLDVKGKEKYEIFKEMIFDSDIEGKIKDFAFDKVKEREELQSTSVGNGIGVAHAKLDNIEDIESKDCKFLSNTNSGILHNSGKLSIHSSYFYNHYYTGIELGGDELYIENSSFKENYSPINLLSGSTAYLINTTFENQIILNQGAKYYLGWYLDISVLTPAPVANPVENANVRLIPNNFAKN